jgi:hypothetical protein
MTVTPLINTVRNDVLWFKYVEHNHIWEAESRTDGQGIVNFIGSERVLGMPQEDRIFTEDIVRRM